METRSTVTTVRTTGSAVTINVSYPSSLPGILKILEIIYGLVCWALLVSMSFYQQQRLYNYIMIVTVLAWVLTIVSFFVYLFALNATACPGGPWTSMEFLFNFVWAVLYFAAAVIVATHLRQSGGRYHVRPHGIAATVFAFITTVLYCIHAVLSCQRWRGAYFWRRSVAGGGTTASTTTTTVHTVRRQ